MAYPLGRTIGVFSLSVLALVVFLSLFERFTSYHCWDEIAKGNMAAALATGGKIIGIGVILCASATYSSIYDFMLWSCIGILLLFAGYMLFEFFTPVFRIDQEIKQRNTAAGMVAFCISVPLALIIAASIV
jgi:putative membrane protein